MTYVAPNHHVYSVTNESNLCTLLDASELFLIRLATFLSFTFHELRFALKDSL